eukprot:UN06047
MNSPIKILCWMLGTIMNQQEWKDLNKTSQRQERLPERIRTTTTNKIKGKPTLDTTNNLLKKRKRELTCAEVDANNKILNNMKRKLNYLRATRNKRKIQSNILTSCIRQKMVFFFTNYNNR